jgi:hypothetical protein
VAASYDSKSRTSPVLIVWGGLSSEYWLPITIELLQEKKSDIEVKNTGAACGRPKEFRNLPAAFASPIDLAGLQISGRAIIYTDGSRKGSFYNLPINRLKTGQLSASS